MAANKVGEETLEQWIDSYVLWVNKVGWQRRNIQKLEIFLHVKEQCINPSDDDNKYKNILNYVKRLDKDYTKSRHSWPEMYIEKVFVMDLQVPRLERQKKSQELASQVLRKYDFSAAINLKTMCRDVIHFTLGDSKQERRTWVARLEKSVDSLPLPESIKAFLKRSGGCVFDQTRLPLHQMLVDLTYNTEDCIVFPKNRIMITDMRLILGR